MTEDNQKFMHQSKLKTAMEDIEVGVTMNGVISVYMGGDVIVLENEDEWIALDQLVRNTWKAAMLYKTSTYGKSGIKEETGGTDEGDTSQ